MSGRTRDGVNKPLICNWEIKDIRMYKETLPQYLADMGTLNPSQMYKFGNNKEHHIPTLIALLCKIMRGITFVLSAGRFVNIKLPSKANEIKFHGFTYVIFLFAVKDPHKKDGVEIL